MNNKLQAKVKARNRLNTEIRARVPQMVAILRQFVNQKVQRADESLTRHVYNALPANPASASFNFRYEGGRCGIHVVFQVCESMGTGKYGCIYDSETVCLANVDPVSKTVTDVIEHSNKYYRADFTVDEILKVRSELEAAKKVVSDLNQKLYPFNENDV